MPLRWLPCCHSCEPIWRWSRRHREKGAGEGGRRKGLSWFRVALGQFPKLETFPRVWVTLRTLGSPGVGGEKGRGSGTSGYVDFVSRGRQNNKRSVPHCPRPPVHTGTCHWAGGRTHTVSASCVMLDPVHVCRDCLPPKCSPRNCYLLSPVVETQFPHCLGEWSCVIMSGLLDESVVFGSCIIQFPVSTYSGNVSLKEHVTICVIYCLPRAVVLKTWFQTSSISAQGCASWWYPLPQMWHQASGVRAQPCGSACSSGDSDAHSTEDHCQRIRTWSLLQTRYRHFARTCIFIFQVTTPPKGSGTARSGTLNQW